MCVSCISCARSRFNYKGIHGILAYNVCLQMETISESLCRRQATFGIRRRRSANILMQFYFCRLSFCPKDLEVRQPNDRNVRFASCHDLFHRTNENTKVFAFEMKNIFHQLCNISKQITCLFL